jgi:hypothetical protein
MSQAKTLTPAELDHVLHYISTQSYPLRNRVMLLTGFWSGMRVGEIASLTIADVVNADGSVKVPGIFAAVPYCIDLIGGPYLEADEAVCAAFRPKSAQRVPGPT